jgi:hypothetical protein
MICALRILLTAACAALLSSTTAADSADILQLSYQAFDQTPGAGWRALTDAKKFHEAATLIEQYVAQHIGLDRFQISNLHWHAVQVLAIAGDTDAALKHVPLSRLDPEPPGAPIRWNDYVEATEAFLRHDRERLVAARDRIAKNQPDDANLPIVNSLVTHFDKSYAEAYKAE